MNWWQYLLLVNLYLVLFYAFYSLLLCTETFFQLNRVYLIASAVLSFLIPLIQADWVHNLFITQQVQHTIYAYAGPEFTYYFKPAEEDHFTVAQILLIIYITGAVILGAKFVWNLVSLKKVISQPAANKAFSFFRSIRVDPETANCELITAHEEVHARQLHSADVLLMEIITIINWFNPVVYLYRLAAKHIHEFIADQQAIKSGTNKADYALLLLSQTLNAPTHQLVNSFFNHSLLKKRIIMLKKTQSKRTALLKYGLSAPLFILMMILSSATVSNSKMLKQIKQKIVDVVLLPPASKNTTKPLVEVKDSVNGPIFTAVEHEPQFKGGITAFYQFLSQNIKYPEAMRNKKIEGKVFVTFVVMKDGSLANIKILRDIGYGAGQESVRVLKLSPKWIPGVQNGKPVNVQYTMPINFALGDKKAAINIKENNKDMVYGTSYTLNKKDSITIGVNTRIFGKDTANKSINKSYQKTPLYVGYKDQKHRPIYVLNGNIVSNINNLDQSTIKSVYVLTDTTATNRYGDKASSGAIVIQTKNSKN